MLPHQLSLCAVCSPRRAHSVAMQRSISCSGVRVGDDDRTGRARRQRVENGRHQVRYATRPLQEADDFTFIVGREE